MKLVLKYNVHLENKGSIKVLNLGKIGPRVDKTSEYYR